jgi:AcrR family transcriptional regulator
VTAGRPRSQTRERILDAAMDLFADNGYAGTPITAIERAVGLAPGTGSFHRHFSSKEELLHAAVEREVTLLLDDIEAGRAALPDVTDPHERRVLEYRQCLDDVRRFERLFRLMLTERERLPDLQRTMANALGFADSSWDQDLTVVVAVAAVGGYHFLGLMQGRPFQGVPPEDFIDALATMVGAGPEARQRTSTRRRARRSPT